MVAPRVLSAAIRRCPMTLKDYPWVQYTSTAIRRCPMTLEDYPWVQYTSTPLLLFHFQMSLSQMSKCNTGLRISPCEVFMPFQFKHSAPHVLRSLQMALGDNRLNSPFPKRSTSVITPSLDGL